MIQWLVQDVSAHPALARGTVPAGLLTPAELTRYQSLASDNRRRDWLLGRWTAKRLLQAVLDGTPALDVIELDNSADGVPLVRSPRALLHGQLSISHSQQHALAAVNLLRDAPLGADLERVVPRSAAFIADYFTPPEQALTAGATDARRPLVANAIWSGKEAALKALQLGLSVDTRAVTCTFALPASPPTTWAPLAIDLDRARLPAGRPPLQGWWRAHGDFVLTLVTTEP